MRSPTPRQWSSIALATTALLALTATARPLLAFLWDLLPPDLPVERILLGVSLVVVLTVAVVSILLEIQSRTSFHLWSLIFAAWAVAIGAVAAMVLLIWLVLGAPGLDRPTDLSPRALDAIATRAFAVVAGLGGVALLVIHYRRQRTSEQGEQREMARLFTESFDAASEKLGSEHATVRLAGVYALARLADEAPAGRDDLVQMIIDVLCAYLRMPYIPAPAPLPEGATDEQSLEHHDHELRFASFQEVRHTIIRVIGDRLHEDTRWRGRNYDFTGVVFDGGDFNRAHFTTGKVSFRRAHFASGTVSFYQTHFSGARVSFTGAKFTGAEIDFTEADFSAGTVSFLNAEFTHGTVNFRHARFTGAAVGFQEAKVLGAEVSFFGAHFADGDLLWAGAKLTGGTIAFNLSVFCGAKVDFTSTQITRGELNFGSALFNEGVLDLRYTSVSGGVITFFWAKFSGTDVILHPAEFLGGTVDFRDSEGTCPFSLVEAQKRAAPGILLLPQAWSPSARSSER
ncbi:pentapeptide repeat-containing protein [Nocardiopsis sp. LDBS0036]|uniref:pentapeptide repeat-containing protein n=1 Tax=Nocardiopsis sp. LDBS0036 TaxID=3104276 RepID=UPI0035168EB1